MLVRVDSMGRRIGTLDDRNANGLRDAGEGESWTELDPSADILDPPVPLPGQAGRRDREPTPGRVVFRRSGAPAGDFVLYLTTDPGQPSAWRAVHVARRSGAGAVTALALRRGPLDPKQDLIPAGGSARAI